MQTHLRTRTKVTVIDLKSKKGTTVDGESINGQERVLSGDEHTIILGGRNGPPLRFVILMTYCWFLSNKNFD